MMRDEEKDKVAKQIIIQYKFIDDKYDKRYDGQEIAGLAFDFWIYKVTDEGKEYYVFSREKLNPEFSEFEGMQINLDDLSDLNSTLKVKKIPDLMNIK